MASQIYNSNGHTIEILFDKEETKRKKENIRRECEILIKENNETNKIVIKKKWLTEILLIVFGGLSIFELYRKITFFQNTEILALVISILIFIAFLMKTYFKNQIKETNLENLMREKLWQSDIEFLDHIEPYKVKAVYRNIKEDSEYPEDSYVNVRFQLEKNEETKTSEIKTSQDEYTIRWMKLEKSSSVKGDVCDLANDTYYVPITN